MELTNTLLLRRIDVSNLLTIEECIISVEEAFKLHAQAKALSPKILGIHTNNGGFHIKAGVLELSRSYFVAKANANFPGNPKQYGLPTIQGVIVVCDGSNGRLLALMDSIEITIIRTGAATAVAAKYLALPDVTTVTICGCGNQGRISLKALMKVRSLEKVYAFDIDEAQAQKFSKNFSNELEVILITTNELAKSLRDSQIVVTCTPSRQPFIHARDIMPGTFIAAVGADSEEKQELFSDLIALNKIVVDLAEQSATIGELHHAIEQKKITLAGIHAELGMIIAGKKPGRESNKEIIIFDSTGMALQDVAAASIVYEKALANGTGTMLNFSDQENNNLNSERLKKNQRNIEVLKSWFPFR
jgi:alanine dehydrogenase